MLNCNFTSSEGGNIRLVQMGVALQHLNHVISEVAPGAPLVFCGDFNSRPNSGNCTPVAMLQQPLPHGVKIPCPDRPLDRCEFLLSPGVFQLVTEAKVPQEHADWSSSGPEESCSIELLSAFPRLLSACNQPVYTNYVGGFHGCLDYIFIQPESMQVQTLAVITV